MKWQILWNRYIEYSENYFDIAHRQVMAFSIVMFINFPLYYGIWELSNKASYENLWLRLSASFFCLLLIFQSYWPQIFKKILLLYWYFTVLYCLPFFFAFMTLKNHGATLWLMNSVSVIFFVILLFEWISSFILLIVGTFFAILTFSLLSNEFSYNPGIVNLSGILATFLAAAIIGAIFSHNKTVVEKEKLEAMQSLGATVAHELRTPLGALKASIHGIERYLPNLIDAYQAAKKTNIVTTTIKPDHFQILKSVLYDAQMEINYSQIIIDMLIKNVQQKGIKNAKLKNCSIEFCVDEALKRYPFSSEKQRELIHFDNSKSFIFKGEEILLIHVLFNLLKNSLYFIEKSQKTEQGEISIWLEIRENWNFLHFRDNGPGISAENLKKIFTRFHTTERHGSGLGLAFCKKVMNGFDGDITCYSDGSHFTEFTLSFPVIK